MESFPSGPDGAPGVLIIDSEELIRAFLQLALQEFGLRVYPFSSIDSVLREREQLVPRIRLVLFDLAQGVDGFKTIMDLFPDRDYLLMSGGIEEAQQAELKGQGIHAILEKPFPLSQLIDHLRQLKLC